MKNLLFVSVVVLGLGADVIVPQGDSDVSITIYNDNRAFVHDKRSVDVPAGRQRIVYEGVANSMITESVVPQFDGVDTILYSQNYIYDLITISSMLKKSIGQKVEFYTNGTDPVLSSGVLLADKPIVMIKQSSTGKILALDKPTQVVFGSIPPNMITKPSLVWNVQTLSKGRLGIDLKYLTSGVTWKSDYVLNLTKDDFDLTGWITINNRSGVTYREANITCLAGDVGRVQHMDKSTKIRKKSAPRLMMTAPAVREQSFAGYHIYKIPFRETIANKEQKQIRFISKDHIKYQQYGIATNRQFESKGVRKLSFRNTIEFANTTANHLGIALPAGIVRMYQKSSSSQTHFIGESRIPNTPTDEKIKLVIGTLFDAVGEKKITKYVARKGYRNVETTYTLHNRGIDPIVLKLRESIPIYGKSIQTKNSCNGICTMQQQSAFTKIFTIKLKPKSSYDFKTEFEVYY